MALPRSPGRGPPPKRRPERAPAPTARATKPGRKARPKATKDQPAWARVRAVAAWIAPEHTRRVAPSRAVLILVLNLFPFPGLGTVIYGHWERGLLQFVLTFVFLLGLVWAAFDGFRILSASLRPPAALRRARTP